MHPIINYKELQKQIGENIEHIRLLKKKTIKEIASAINLTDTGYRNIERGITDISVSKLFQLAVILEVGYVQLMKLDLDNFIKNDVHEKQSNHFNKLMEENHRLRIQQYKEENNFLKKQIEVLENILAKNELNNDNGRRFRSG